MYDLLLKCTSNERMNITALILITRVFLPVVSKHNDILRPQVLI